MAIDNTGLVYLLDPFWQGENLNGKPLVGGYMCVYVAGTDTKYITYQNFDGTRNPFKIPLGSDGRAVIIVEAQYKYDCYLYDSFGNMVCSRLNVAPDVGSDVSVSGLTEVYHDDSISGDGTPYAPLSVVSGGKVYEGVEPIVVNNELDKISANHVALGLQDPLYFVEDSETACIIGCSAQAEIPSATSGKWEDAADTVIANSAQWADGASYEAGSYVDITDNTISVTGLPTSADVQNIVDVATSGLMPSGNYLTKESADTLYAPTGNYLTGLPEDLVYSADITGFATTVQLDGKLDKSDSGKFYPMDSNPSGYLNELPSDLATTGFVAGVSAEITGMIPAPFDPAYLSGQIDNKLDSAIYATDSGTFLTALPADMATTGDINDLAQSISETYQPKGNYLTTADSAEFYTTGNPSGFLAAVPAGYATENWVTSQGYLTAETDWTDTITAASANAYEQATAAIPAPFDPSYISAQVDNKLNSAIYAADSGNFLTAHQALPQSANWNSTYNTVRDNSGSWTGGGAATLPVSGSAGYNSAVYGLHDMKIEYNLPSVGGSEPEHAYTLIDNGSITVHGSYDEEQSYSQVYINPDYIHLHSPSDGDGYIVVTDVLNWNSTYGTVRDNSASWTGGGSTYTGDAQGALDEVYSNSANWNETYSAVSSNSADWNTVIDVSAGDGIVFNKVNNVVYIEADIRTGSI